MNKTKLTSHLAFGLVTYIGIIITYLISFLWAWSAYHHWHPDGFWQDLKWTTFSLPFLTIYIYGFLGWVVAVPGLILALINITKPNYKKLNSATIVISTIILIWNITSHLTSLYIFSLL